MAGDQIHAGFVRNRRFLVAVSIGLSCVKLLDLHFTKVSVLGNEAEIHNPSYVSILEWVVWGWALAQYSVWFNDIGAARQLRQAIVDDCEQTLGERVETEPIPQKTKTSLAGEIRNRHRPLSDDQFKYVARYARMHGDGKHIERAADIEAIAVVRLPDQDGEDRAGPNRFERVISPEEWDEQWKVSRRTVLLRSRFLLEYFAPYMIAVFPLMATTVPILVQLLQHWFTAK
jgi:hypothetical protein